MEDYKNIITVHDACNISESTIEYIEYYKYIKRIITDISYGIFDNDDRVNYFITEICWLTSPYPSWNYSENKERISFFKQMLCTIKEPFIKSLDPATKLNRYSTIEDLYHIIMRYADIASVSISSLKLDILITTFINEFNK